MKHFAIVFVMSLFVLLYVWQNIEIMKTKMDYKKMIRAERVLAEKNARLKFELERLRSFSSIESKAGTKGLVRLKPSDVIAVNGKNGKVKENGKKVK